MSCFDLFWIVVSEGLFLSFQSLEIIDNDSDFKTNYNIFLLFDAMRNPHDIWLVGMVTGNSIIISIV